MEQYLYQQQQPIVRQSNRKILRCLLQLLLLCIILQKSPCLCGESKPSPDLELHQQLYGGKDPTALAILPQAINRSEVSAHSIGQPKQQQQRNQRRITPGNHVARPTSKSSAVGGKKEDALQTNCFAKRDDILARLSRAKAAGSDRSGLTPASSPVTGFQRLRPRVDSGGQTLINSNITDTNKLEGEHVPKCRQDGSYEPVQCHEIGYCWCVNKFGQAIKNSSFKPGEGAGCEPGMYESEGNNQLVVAGISNQRAKGLLKPGKSVFHSTTPDGHINFEATEATTNSHDESSSELAGDEHQQVEQGHRLGHEPVMPLIPNDCRKSRDNAKIRAATQVTDSIWIPECDRHEERLYAEQQCHKTRVCWCVDQLTGLPLRTSEQLSVQPLTHNCTEMKRILGITTHPSSAGSMRSPSQAETMPFYRGSSEYCDSEKRAEFVVLLNNQFRQQISEFVRQNPASMPPADFGSTNPYQISESQVAIWKFSIMDQDNDRKIGDREWNKFKNNFKLVDKPADLDNPSKQQKSPHFLLPPLLIVRSQRKCWRDFLEYCGNGELTDESISLSIWLVCTDVPPRSSQDEKAHKNPISISPENTYALSREAAINRSQKKNPFLGILKPD